MRCKSVPIGLVSSVEVEQGAAKSSVSFRENRPEIHHYASVYSLGGSLFNVDIALTRRERVSNGVCRVVYLPE